MITFSKTDEKNFADIFGGYDDNVVRMDRYLEKRPLARGPWILEYEANGEELFTSGTTQQDAVKRTNEKHPDGWIFTDILTEKAWFEREKKS